ncbi:hypothetical protein CsSME_00007813 [Camellia sinensis var. sinensis]
MDKTLEYLRRDERDVLDKSGPKIIRHKPITALLSPTELDPYIPLHTASEEFETAVRFSRKGTQNQLVHSLSQSFVHFLRTLTALNLILFSRE